MLVFHNSFSLAHLPFFSNFRFHVILMFEFYYILHLYTSIVLFLFVLINSPISVLLLFVYQNHSMLLILFFTFTNITSLYLRLVFEFITLFFIVVICIYFLFHSFSKSELFFMVEVSYFLPLII